MSVRKLITKEQFQIFYFNQIINLQITFYKKTGDKRSRFLS